MTPSRINRKTAKKSLKKQLKHSKIEKNLEKPSIEPVKDLLDCARFRKMTAIFH
jgi:hypothetical protein